MKRRNFIATGCAALSVGCANTLSLQDQRAEGWPRTVIPPRALAPRGLALVLGSGGPRGFAHIGALKALEELKIVPDLVVGSSVGAVIGALVAARVSAAEIEATALSLRMWDIMDLSWEALTALRAFTGQSVGELVARMSRQRDIAALPLPFAAAATRVLPGKADAISNTYEAVAFNAGNLPLAIRASAAIVGAAPMVGIDGQMYCDGDYIAPLPAKLAQLLGAKRIIAVDVSAYEQDTPTSVRQDRPQWMEQAQWRQAQTTPELPYIDAYLHIRTPYFTGFSDSYRKQLIAQGYEQTMQKRDALLKLAGTT
jgi:NTE family protein